MVDKNATEQEEVLEEAQMSAEDVEKEKFERLSSRLLEAGVPEEIANNAIKAWKKQYGNIQVAYLNSGAYIYRKITWGDMKNITTTLTNLGKSGNATEATMRMTDLELTLEKAVLYPQISPKNSNLFPSGDLEALQELINQFSGYEPVPPEVEDI